MSTRRLYLVAYDVRDPSRLRRVLHVVKAYSTGGQKSVHECFLGPAELMALRTALGGVIDAEVDSVLIVRLPDVRGVRTLGIARAPRDHGFFYLP